MTKLKQQREAAGLSQSQLAEKSGVKTRQIQGFEQRERDINKAAALTVYNLAKALGCDIEKILEN